MKRTLNLVAVAMALSVALMLAGCGGGGGGGDTSQGTIPGSAAPNLAWDPPTTFADSSPMNPYAELDYYELYLRTDPSFTDNDPPVAQVSAVANVIGPDGQTTIQTLTNIFDLNNLAPFVQNGNVYYLSIKSVGVDGLKSSFSVPVIWNQG
jgi:hypothetical protein